MASHGAPRLEGVKPRTEQDKRREKERIRKYKTIEESFVAAFEAESYNQSTLDICAELLEQNPEYYTIWNHRRRVLLHILESIASNGSPEKSSVKDYITADLDLVLSLIVKYPKCYWIWSYRLWLLDRAAKYLTLADLYLLWQRELGFVGKMLARDVRNFHGWSYRRKVIQNLRVINEKNSQIDTSASVAEGSDIFTLTQYAENLSLTEADFEYTTKMIKSNLSNFSAWHNRSKLIFQLLEERQATEDERKAMFDEELNLIESAVLMDPYDQSLWFYHEFTMRALEPGSKYAFVRFTDADRRQYLEREISAIRELLEDTDDCKYIYFHLLIYCTLYQKVGGAADLVSKSDMEDWLTRLEALDTLREGRWRDLEKDLMLRTSA